MNHEDEPELKTTLEAQKQTLEHEAKAASTSNGSIFHRNEPFVVQFTLHCLLISLNIVKADKSQEYFRGREELLLLFSLVLTSLFTFFALKISYSYLFPELTSSPVLFYPL